MSNTDYNITGIDLDWEYPGKNNTCFGNIVSNDDNKNFGELLKKIKEKINNIEISMAVPINPWINKDDNKDFIQYLDYINIMVYDVNGAYWSNMTASNSPYINMIESVEKWRSLGFNKDQIIVGLPFYGRTFYAKYEPIKPNVENIIDVGNVKGGPSDEPWNDKCFDNKTLGEYAKNNDNKVYSTIWSYSEIVEDFRKNNYWIKSWDYYSNTPYAYYKKNTNNYWYYISYDDECSIKNKIRYVKNQKIGGIMTWEITQDYNNTLLNTVYENLNK